MNGLSSVWLRHGAVEAEVVPGRGALITVVRVDGEDLLWLDRSTVEDTSKSVRGGIPLLFPFAGRLADDTLRATGQPMKQHGFARHRPWEVLQASAGHVLMELPVDDEIALVWPWTFRLTQGVWATSAGIHVELNIHNTGPAPMPISPGWHPYFPADANKKTQTNADVAGLDSKQLVDDAVFDFGLPAPPHGRVRLQPGGGPALKLEFDPVMRHVQFWSLPHHPFVCVEPFFGGNNTINTSATLVVPPGSARVLWMRIEKA